MEQLVNVIIDKFAIERIAEGVFVNFLWASVGGSIVLIMKFLFGFVHRKIQEYRQIVAGKYISFYEDENDKGRIFKSAEVELKQKGFAVTGSTFFEKKKWQLKGELAKGMYLYGMYWSANPQDSGTGNFFLEIKENDNRKVIMLKGIWSGYDSENHKITSGEYIFYRKIEPKITLATKSSVPRILAIAENQLGKDYISEASLDFDKNIILKAQIENETVGFSISKLIDKEEFKNEFNKVAGMKNRVINSIDKIGVIRTIAVSLDFQRRGIGNKLLKESLLLLSQRGAEIIIIVGWKSCKGTKIHSLAQLNNFRIIGEIKNYWYEDSQSKMYGCPVCGEPPCECSAVIYSREPEES